jgi:hypothetical protein
MNAKCGQGDHSDRAGEFSQLKNRKIVMTTKKRHHIGGIKIKRKRRIFYIYSICPFGTYDSLILHDGEGKVFASTAAGFKCLKKYFDKERADFDFEYSDFSIIDEKRIFNKLLKNKFDSKAQILNAINNYDDCLININYTMSPDCKNTLYHFADYLTFDSDFGPYMTEKGLLEKDLRCSLAYLFNSVWSHVKILDTNTPESAYLRIVRQMKQMV